MESILRKKKYTFTKTFLDMDRYEILKQSADRFEMGKNLTKMYFSKLQVNYFTDTNNIYIIKNYKIVSWVDNRNLRLTIL